ncbi:hypothetical protein CGSMWGv6119V5_05301 [Gardnerella vaginalis 6119V5]|uniref:hypothetical protein n=1 Tax=Gardnerella vaginalis TaxID=2702 RepID=UPI0002634CD7|nr:hypothetical protein [Gardnerella vaginalis]EIK87055.1 hypothetical protein CGSMWGv6119V5_05301 [Gardnerella vaginalis 6119V5]
MDSNNLPSINHSQNTEENNENQINDYTNNANPANTYQNNTYQNNGYQNDYQNGYQNGYQNYYQNDTYQNYYQNDTYQNDYQNDYQNGYQNDYQNGYQNNTYQNNGYQNNNNPINNYINSDNLIKTYKNVQQQVISFVNTTLADEHKKRIAIIAAIVLAVILFGGLISGAFKSHYNCSAEKSANIEEYVNCHTSDFEERGDDDISATFDAQGDNLNITIKFKDRVPDNAISKAEATFSDRLFLSNLFPAVEEAKNKVSSPIHLYYTILNDDDSVIYKDDFIDE